MSYNNTVYCGWCHGKGHNQRSCVKKKQYIKENPTSTIAIWETSRDKHRGKTSRICSYCAERGHNVRTCEIKKSDKELLSQRLKAQRVKVFEAMVELGFGIGALVATPKHYWEDDASAILYLVKSIHWPYSDKVGSVEWAGQNVATGRIRNMRTNLDSTQRHHSPGYSIDVLSAGSLGKVPETWKEGRAYNAAYYFPKGSPRPTWWVLENSTMGL